MPQIVPSNQPPPSPPSPSTASKMPVAAESQLENSISNNATSGHADQVTEGGSKQWATANGDAAATANTAASSDDNNGMAAVAPIITNGALDGLNPRPQQVIASDPSTATTTPPTSGNVSNPTTSTNATPATKLNGLKNRIIQRPPPLVLDKVSNFYDNDTNTSIVQPQHQWPSTNRMQHNHSATNLATRTSRDLNENNAIQTSDTNKLQQDPSKQQANCQNAESAQCISRHQSQAAVNDDDASSASTSNKKFWASLNENAFRNKTKSSTITTTSTTSTFDASTLPPQPFHDNTATESLGNDLIIKHRNSSASSTPNRTISGSRNRHHHQSHFINQQQHTGNNRHELRHNNYYHHHRYDVQRDIHALNENAPTTVEGHQDNELTTSTSLLRPDSREDNNYSRTRAISNTSNELDEGGAPSENGGGNLIGVDNPTPPALDTFDNPPASATSSRPRSNNPFLDDDDGTGGQTGSYKHEQAESLASSHNSGNFHKRPASFIAATDRPTRGIRAADQFSANQQQIVEEKLNELKLSERQSDVTIGAQDLSTGQDQLDSRTEHIQLNDHQNQHQMSATIGLPNTTNSGNNSATAFYSSSSGARFQEPTISLDSESAVCQLPPSKTMQLAHWTEAIYELNNAILETSSVAGGAENGQFVYIVENGDIVLELDRIGVSGLTLIEFNELVESKQFHLLKAVQTKHSHGLTNDLKSYLNQSFPKESRDRRLQVLIRENIYRRTIPCTTRPPKPGEQDGVDYHFLSRDQFVELNKRNMLLECGIYHEQYYGTLKPLSDLSNLSIYSSAYQKEMIGDGLRQSWDANHPAVEMMVRKDALQPHATITGEHPLYENHESLRMQAAQQHNVETGPANDIYGQTSHQNRVQPLGEMQPANSSSIVAVDSEALPPGWERVFDQAHGTYYIDHNTKRTQYERPYEVELTKGARGFGFTLVEADNGLLLVRSVIPGGPAHMNGSIRPGDILVSAVGVSVTGLQHNDIARLFSTFAMGDRVRLTFARSNYVLDENIVPDEYLFSNGTNGDLAVAVNPNGYNQLLSMADGQQEPIKVPPPMSPHILVDQEFEFASVTLKRGDQGFGFTISDSMAGQKVRKIQNHEVCANLRQGDILINLNGEDITKLSHKEVVEKLKTCPAGEDVTLTVKRKKRFRSKTPVAMHTDQAKTGEFSLDSTPQRKCKTPSLDNLMLRRPPPPPRPLNGTDAELVASQNPFQPAASLGNLPLQSDLANYNAVTYPSNSVTMNGAPPHVVDPVYGSLPVANQFHQHPQQQQQLYSLQHQTIYDCNPLASQQQHHQPVYCNQQASADAAHRSTMQGEVQGIDDNEDAPNSIAATEASQQMAPPLKSNLNANELSQVNQYNNFMNNDKLMMMQMQQQQQQQQQIYHQQLHTSDYHHVPLYSNSDILGEQSAAAGPGGYLPSLPIKPPINQHHQQAYLYQQQADANCAAGNFYANNEEIALQSVQYNNGHHVLHQQEPAPHGSTMPAPGDHFNFMPAQALSSMSHQGAQTPHDEHDEYEYHHVELTRDNTDSNWGIRLIGGAEVDRAISIGSMIFGGVAAKSGKLNSGDEIISIDGVSVVGATHHHVVDMISARTNRVLLVVRRKTFAEACDVVLTKNMDEGFGFVIISSENCALIGKIIEGSPADRCRQLRIRDCIIAVNGRFITPDMKHPEIVNMIKECGSTLRLRIIPVDCYTVKLIKDVQNDSFGFRMRGGSEYDGTPLYIVRVEMNGQAHGLLNVGDQILEINNIPTVGMTHSQAATIIKYSDPIVKLKLRRNYVTPPSLLVDSPRALQKYNQVTAEMKAVSLSIGGSRDGSLPLAGAVGSGASLPPVEQSVASFSSLPADVDSLVQQQQQRQQQHPGPAPSGWPDGQQHHHQQQQQQPIYEHHSLNYLDQNTLYAT